MKKIIYSSQAPEPIGPYSQAVEFKGLLFISGQIALDTNGDLKNENVEIETEQVMKNIGFILEKADLNYSHILKCSIFLSSMEDFQVVNKIYGSYFKKDPPARETVEVSTLPKNVKVEISCIAGKI